MTEVPLYGSKRFYTALALYASIAVAVLTAIIPDLGGSAKGAIQTVATALAALSGILNSVFGLTTTRVIKSGNGSQ